LVVVTKVLSVVYVQKEPTKDLTVKYVKKGSFVENVCLVYVNLGCVTNALFADKKTGERKTPIKR
tara:strand:+ start:357 stop:551 length:195 start_codon:yes stop_codon:yes gene_type:complete